MSIVACVKVYDGFAMGAESMTQLVANVNGQAQVVKAYSHAQKIFQIANYPICALTYGGGNIGTRSMESFVHQFSEAEQQLHDPDKSVREVAQRLLTFLRTHYDPAFANVPEPQRPVIGFYLAGYSPGGPPNAAEWEFLLPAAQTPTEARPANQYGASWRGVSIPFTRLLFGADPRLEQIFANLGVDQAVIQQARTLVRDQLLSKVAFDGMPIQDAIGFCKFIIDTTIGMATYEIGVASCGGPVNIAVISRAGFEWVSKPKFTLQIAKE